MLLNERTSITQKDITNGYDVSLGGKQKREMWKEQKNNKTK